MTKRNKDDTEQANRVEGEDVLTPFEENIVRMSQGLAEDDDYELSFGLGADAESKEQLAKLEWFLVGMFEEAEQFEGQPEDVFEELEEQKRERVISSLSVDKKDQDL